MNDWFSESKDGLEYSHLSGGDSPGPPLHILNLASIYRCSVRRTAEAELYSTPEPVCIILYTQPPHDCACSANIAYDLTCDKSARRRVVSHNLPPLLITKCTSSTVLVYTGLETMIVVSPAKPTRRGPFQNRRSACEFTNALVKAH